MSGKTYDTISLVDSRFQWIESEVRGSKVGNTAVSHQRLVPRTTAFQAGKKVDWDQISTDPSSCVDSAPRMAVELSVVFNVAGDTADAILAKVNECIWGFNSFPVNRLFDNVNIRLNDKVNTPTTPGSMLDTIAPSLSKEQLLEISPYSAPDMHWNYDPTSVADAITHPLDSALGWTRHYRTADVLGITANADADTLTFRVRIEERLCANPLQWMDRKPSPFIGLNKLRITTTLASDLTQCLAVAGLPDGGSVNRVAIDDMALILDTYTPHAKVSLPSKSFYPYFQTTETGATGDSVTINAGASHSFVVPRTSYNSIPKLICVRAWQIDRTATRPIRNLPITHVELTINNAQRRLQGMTQAQLYALSRQNGYSLSYQCFSGSFDSARDTANGNTGCVMYLLPSDIDLPDLKQSNVMSKCSIEASVTVHNPSNAGATVQMELVVVEDMILQQNGGNYDGYDAMVTSTDLQSSKAKVLNEGEFEYLGGSFWGDVWSGIKKVVKSPLFKKAVHFARNNIPGLSTYANDSTPIGMAMSHLGAGPKSTEGKGLVDSRESGGNVVNLAGAKFNRADLMKMLDQ